MDNESDMDLTDCEILQESDSEDGDCNNAVPMDMISQMVNK